MFKDKFFMWLVWKLPNRIVFWAAMRVWTYGTIGKYGDTIVSELTVIEAMKRWESDKLQNS